MLFFEHTVVCSILSPLHRIQVFHSEDNPQTHQQYFPFCCLNFLHTHSHYIQYCSNPDQSIGNYLHKSTTHCSVLALKSKHGCVQYIAQKALDSQRTISMNQHPPPWPPTSLLVSTSSTHFWSTPEDFNPFALGTTAAMH